MIPESSRNSTGWESWPCSHINEKNHTPLSPIQNSAGVKANCESSGGCPDCGTYSPCQPKASPFHASPARCSCRANSRTAGNSGTTTGSTDSCPSTDRILACTVATFLLLGNPGRQKLFFKHRENPSDLIEFVGAKSSGCRHLKCIQPHLCFPILPLYMHMRRLIQVSLIEAETKATNSQNGWHESISIRPYMYCQCAQTFFRLHSVFMPQFACFASNPARSDSHGYDVLVSLNERDIRRVVRGR